ncbi:Cytochrome c [Bradyrhizobium lablabi]|uniref:Cytochrome c n=2 Tax=Bradyrhizobium TaxID=374 RepID=A0ABY0PYY0_9BRAD|nr:Cytochrome c [Bradyrhizobium ottawaense]SEC83981.1 Cytochrome c [Bradyrhizobium lablabi]
MEWIPTITERSGPVYIRIVDVLSADIASGRLTRGQQLPTHRAPARALDIDLTTVTRAYSEARRRGLIDARVGRGTFVSETTARVATDPPLGSGTVNHGREIFDQQCAACHGARGEGSVGGRLVGGQGTLATPNRVRTVGSSYWPYATTSFDYIRRAMSQNAPHGLLRKKQKTPTGSVSNPASQR